MPSGAEGADGGAQVIDRGKEIGGGLGGSEGKDGVGGYMFKEEEEDVRVTIGTHGQVGRNVHVPLFAGAEPKMIGEGGFAEQAADAWAVRCGAAEDEVTTVVGVGLD